MKNKFRMRRKIKIARKKVDVFFFFLFDNDTNDSIPVTIEDKDIPFSEELEFFFNDRVRKVWHKQKQEWFFSITDVVSVLTDSNDPKQYIKKMRQRDPELGARWSTICTPTPMIAADGKKYSSQATDTAGLLRIIQSIPSPKAEPLKQWLACVGKERLEEIADPELAIERAIFTYRKKGYSEEWIQKRLDGIKTRKELTDEWYRAGVTESKDYAKLTDTLTKAWSGKHIKEYKAFKGLHKESLRDNMTDIELALNQLAELSTTLLSRAQNPEGYKETDRVTREGGSVAGNARKDLEARLGRSVISKLNAASPNLLSNTTNE